MNRSLFGFLVFLSVLTLAVALGIWIIGPTLVSLAFDDDRRDQPYAVLLFSRTSDAAAERTRLFELMAADGGQLVWQTQVRQLVTGRERDDWQMVDLVVFERAAGLVKVATSSEFRSLMGTASNGERLLLGTATTPVDAPGPVQLMALVAFDEDAGRLTASPAERLGYLSLLEQHQGQLEWETSLDVFADGAEWNFLIMLSFPSMAAVSSWLADPEVVTALALGRRYRRDAALLLLSTG